MQPAEPHSAAVTEMSATEMSAAEVRRTTSEVHSSTSEVHPPTSEMHSSTAKVHPSAAKVAAATTKVAAATAAAEAARGRCGQRRHKGYHRCQQDRANSKSAIFHEYLRACEYDPLRVRARKRCTIQVLPQVSPLTSGAAACRDGR